MQVRNLGAVVILLALAWQPFAHGQEASSAVKGTSPPAAKAHISPQASTSKDMAEINTRLITIQSDIAILGTQVNKTNSSLAWIGSLFGFLGVLAGGLVTYLTQGRLLENQQVLADKATTHATELAEAKATQELLLAENRAKIEIGNSFVQWQLEQLSELYGPLRALLQQSNVMYRHMNAVLVKTEPKKFRLRDCHGEDFDNKLFEIQLNGTWVPFRTILHIDEVYGKNYHIEDYFDAVVAIGSRIVKVIEENAGYARPEQSDQVLSVFGRYLAHYAVLERLYSQTKEKCYPSGDTATGHAQPHVPTEQTISVDDSAVFPKEIQGLIDAGFKEIIRELNDWRAKAAA